MEYEAREKALRDYNQGLLEAEERGWNAGEKVGIEKGIERGIEKGIEKGIKTGEYQKAVQIARNMLMKNFDINLTAEISGLSVAQVEQLLKEEKML